MPVRFPPSARRAPASPHLLGVVLLLLGAGCAGGSSDRSDDGGTRPPAPTGPAPLIPAQLSATGETTRADSVGATQPVTVRVTTAGGVPVPNAVVAFAASTGSVVPTTIATGTDGTATATWTLDTRPGQATLTASSGALPAVAFTATIRPGAPARVSVSPRSALLTDFGDTVRLRAAATDRFGNATAGVSATWRSLDAATVTVEGDGLARSQATGVARVVASIDASSAAGARTEDTVTVQVTPEPVALVELSQRAAWLLVGDTLRITAVPRGASGRPLRRSVRWTTSEAAVATVTTEGLVRVTDAGAATITAEADGRVGTVTVTSAPGGGVRVPALAAIDSAVIEYLRREAIPGAQVGVVRDGRLVFLRGYGWADVQARRPVVPNALFRIGSVSKPVAAVAVLQLVDKGRLRLDDRPFTLLDHLSVLPGEQEDPRLGQITVRNLLNQAGGWDGATRAVDYRVWEGTWRYGVRDAAELVRHGRGVPLVDAPGSRYAYTNYSTQVLGRVVEKVSGESFEHYVRANVLAPQGITRMQFGNSALDRRDLGEVRYYGPDGQPVDGNTGAMENWDAAGRWVASAGDMLRFLNGIEGRNGSPASLSPAMRSALTERPAAIWPGTTGCHYAAFLWVCPDRGGQSWNHTGAPEGGHALLERRGDGTAFVILINRERPSITLNLRPLFDAVQAWPTHNLF